MFIKIDIDGGELDALQSIGLRWSDFKGGLLVEVHSQQLKDDCLALLEERRFFVPERTAGEVEDDTCPNSAPYGSTNG